MQAQRDQQTEEDGQGNDDRRIDYGVRNGAAGLGSLIRIR